MEIIQNGYNIIINVGYTTILVMYCTFFVTETRFSKNRMKNGQIYGKYDSNVKSTKAPFSYAPPYIILLAINTLDSCLKLPSHYFAVEASTEILVGSPPLTKKYSFKHGMSLN